MADKAISSLAESGAPPRKKYRLVYKGNETSLSSNGGTVTAEQMEEFEKKYPNIAVWVKDAPISTPPSQTNPGKPNGRLQDGVLNSPQPRSSRGGAKKWQQLAKQLVREIHNFDDTRIFLKPVDPVRDECSDYFTVVKHPMDFGTIRKKLHKGEYEDALGFYEDCDLVFTNCALYNAPETFVMQQCRKIMARFNELLVQLELTGHIEAARAERKKEVGESKEEEDAHGETTVNDVAGAASTEAAV
ncbi:transcription factor GTE6, putative [Perkinsus marinus ATCC 50983]|uniref:Transcription factor GTE6, putative n=1 Tax=Perkinsus marinus (strain ATCC 50983 / TXsc) TaxID=423536 RepID=C5LNN6_PERM5|nr:transcription factor GTE6, putative [Perkinsus marinus ATCC 50983]EER01655.1 transcription factor GTE6, putative [Perkinsus marinus ATCC 50983]|eukprot:XP_002768937.1 transcription factor GTE6, putative [Perkinsus marinus ATCC 50983]